VSKYNWTCPGFTEATGHFTQLVWVATSQMGTGCACSSNNQTCYVVANYYTPGNYANQYVTNVKPATC